MSSVSQINLKQIFTTNQKLPNDEQSIIQFLDQIFNANLDEKPSIVPLVDEYSKLKAVSISGSLGTLSSLLLLKTSISDIEYIITTTDVLKASPTSQLFFSNVTLKYLRSKFNFSIIQLEIGDDLDSNIREAKNLLSYVKDGGINVTGLPSLFIAILSKITMGQLYFYVPSKYTFYVL